MPGDPFKRVLPGQNLEIPAAAYNAFLEAARIARGRLHDTDRDETELFRQTGIVQVRNNTGFALPRFAVIALAEPIIGPLDNLVEFQTRVTYEGVVPEEPPASGIFAVLIEPLDSAAIGRGVVAGVTPVKMFVDPARLYEFAEVAGGNTGSLLNAPTGSARVLWLEESGSSERWAIVRLGDGENHVRFQLITALARCGSAEANLVVYRDGKWCPVEAMVTVYDSLGVVGATFAGGTSGSGSGSGEGCNCPSVESVPVGTFGVAKYFADSRKWEVVILGEGCCSSSSSSSGGSSSGSASGSSSWSSSSWDSSGSSSGWSSSSSSWGSSSGSDGSGSSWWSSSGSSWSGSSWWGSSGSDGSSSWLSSDGSSSGMSSGSGSSGSGSGVGIIETDVRCEDGKLTVYNRTVTLRIENGALTREEGSWTVSHQAGCCCCENCGSGSSSGSGSSLWVGSSSLVLPSSSGVMLSSSDVAWPSSSWIEPPSSSDVGWPSSSSSSTSGIDPLPSSSSGWVPPPSSSLSGWVPPTESSSLIE